MLGKPEPLRVELFGNVKTQQSPAFNHQLQHQLREFDRLYEIHGGHVGSPGHQFDRQEFARVVSKGMLNDFKNNDGTFTMLETETSFNCASISCEMNIKTKTTFGGDAVPASSMPFYEPN